jgi:hypothetical protein
MLSVLIIQENITHCNVVNPTRVLFFLHHPPTISHPFPLHSPPVPKRKDNSATPTPPRSSNHAMRSPRPRNPTQSIAFPTKSHTLASTLCPKTALANIYKQNAILAPTHGEPIDGRVLRHVLKVSVASRLLNEVRGVGVACGGIEATLSGREEIGFVGGCEEGG